MTGEVEHDGGNIKSRPDLNLMPMRLDRVITLNIVLMQTERQPQAMTKGATQSDRKPLWCQAACLSSV